MKDQEVKKTNRQSNLELLRIISMIMIFIYHYCIHGDIILRVTDFTGNKILGMILTCLGRAGVNAYILISGYFLIESKFKIKKYFKLVLQVMFYTIGLYFINLYVTKASLSDYSIYYSLFPIFNVAYWFMTVYAFTYLFSPFINKAIKGMGQKGLARFIILFGIIFSIIPGFTLKEMYVYSSFIFFIYIYIIGAYIRLYDIKVSKKWLLPVLFVGSVVIEFAGFMGITLYDLKFHASVDSFWPIRSGSFAELVGGVSLFLMFKNLNIKDNKIINYFAKISTATYLISDYEPLRRYFWDVFVKAPVFARASFIKFCIHIAACVVLIYVLAAIGEFIRVYCIERPIFKIKIFDKYLDKVDNWMNNY